MGKAWCDNLEAYSDFSNRLPRGRTYVRNGSVIDLKIEPGKVMAHVMGSRLYRIEIAITAVSAAQWKGLVKECTGSIATLVELLQGKFSKAVMERLCAPKSGLFPAPKEIRLDCSCPDWATMCKHVAAVLYGVGARLDEKPELLFVLRQVDANDLLAAHAAEIPRATKAPAKARVLDDSSLADVFGIELATANAAAVEAPGKRRATPSVKAAGRGAAAAAAAKSARKTSGAKAAATSTKKPLAKAATEPAVKRRSASKKAPAPKPAARRKAGS